MSACEHRHITTWVVADGPEKGKVIAWACHDCRLRFEPADERLDPEAVEAGRQS